MKMFVLMILINSVLIVAQQVNVMSYNIRYANEWDNEDNWELRKNEIVNLIKLYEPEIIGTQEALHGQIKFLDSSLVNYSYVGVGREDGSTKGEYSAIIFDSTKYSLLTSSTFWLSETPDQISVGWDAALERICTFALLSNNISNDSIWVFNTHFDHIGKVARSESAKLIIRKINKINQNPNIPVILMGDFNALPEDEPIIEIIKYFDDSWIASINGVSGPVGTFNNFNTEEKVTRRIDYIFSKNLRAIKTEHISTKTKNNRYPSDHLPVMTSFEMNKK